MLAILVMLARSGDIGRPWMHWSIWMLNFLLTLQLTFNTVANFMSPSPPERWIMGPACAVGCLLCGVSLLAPRRVR